MTLVSVITVLGWIFTITPLVIFLVISVNMVRGAMKDDGLIKTLVMIALTVFFTGVGMLLLMYLVDVFDLSINF